MSVHVDKTTDDATIPQNACCIMTTHMLSYACSLENVMELPDCETMANEILCSVALHVVRDCGDEPYALY